MTTVMVQEEYDNAVQKLERADLFCVALVSRRILRSVEIPHSLYIGRPPSEELSAGCLWNSFF